MNIINWIIYIGYIIGFGGWCSLITTGLFIDWTEDGVIVWVLSLIIGFGLAILTGWTLFEGIEGVWSMEILPISDLTYFLIASIGLTSFSILGMVYDRVVRNHEE